MQPNLRHYTKNEIGVQNSLWTPTRAFFRVATLWLVLVLSIGWFVIPTATTAQSDDELVVRAVLFYSPSCPHCHYVISEVLSPLAETYGDQLELVGIDTSQLDGAQLYDAAIEHYQIPANRRGVPTLVVADTVLVGSLEIPEQFPQLVEQGLASGGVGWPDIPGLTPILPQKETATPASSPEPVTTIVPTLTLPATTFVLETATSNVVSNPAASPSNPMATPDPAVMVIGESEPPYLASPPTVIDPVGFSLAGLVLVGLVVALIYSVWRLARDRTAETWARHWFVPILALVGLVVAGYLAYVEVSHVDAVCGPIGECNLVQASPYAKIFGVPVAVLGVLSYFALVGLWIVQRYPAPSSAIPSTVGLVGLTILGTIFSIYLTFLELWVIQAVCLWCLSSAVITAVLMVLIVTPIVKNQNSRFHNRFSR